MTVIGRNDKGKLFFNDPYGKFNPLRITNNGFLKEHDIRVDVQEKDGKPVSLTIQMANAGALSLDEETFRERNEPTAYMKCSYNKMLATNLFRALRMLSSRFSWNQELGVPVSYSMIVGGNGSSYPITQEQYESVDYEP